MWRPGPLLLLLLGLLAGCDDGDVGDRRMLVEGDPAAGLEVMRREGCGACHLVPGLRGARGRVGPPLAGFARRGYIAGQFPNRAPLLIRWISEAPTMVPQTAMPGFALTDRELRDVAAYLYQME